MAISLITIGILFVCMFFCYVIVKAGNIADKRIEYTEYIMEQKREQM